VARYCLDEHADRYPPPAPQLTPPSTIEGRSQPPSVARAALRQDIGEGICYRQPTEAGATTASRKSTSRRPLRSRRPRLGAEHTLDAALRMPTASAPPGARSAPHKATPPSEVTSPGGAVIEREKGFEPSTSTLARWHSTAELLPRKGGFRTFRPPCCQGNPRGPRRFLPPNRAVGRGAAMPAGRTA
jgi:hypothetical protein